MLISIAGISYKLPSSLNEITLQDRITYDQEHGKLLSEKLKKVSDIKDKNIQDLEFSEYNAECACRTLSFFGKIPLPVVQDTDLGDVFAVYNAMMHFFSEEIDFSNPDAVITHEFEWKDATWQIHPVELKQGSKMAFREFITAKQLVQNLYELGDEKWQALLHLCCVFLRKVGEPFTEDMINEDGERMKLMRTVPLDKALNVGFFLTSIIGSYKTTFHFSSHPEQSLVGKQ